MAKYIPGDPTHYYDDEGNQVAFEEGQYITPEGNLAGGTSGGGNTSDWSSTEYGGIEDLLNMNINDFLNQYQGSEDQGLETTIGELLDMEDLSTYGITNVGGEYTYDEDLVSDNMGTIGDPTLRGILLDQLGGGIEDRTEEQRELLRQSVGSFREADILETNEAIEKSLQKRGLLTSGATTEKMVRENAASRLKAQGMLQEGELDIMQQALQERLGYTGQLTEQSIAESELQEGARQFNLGLESDREKFWADLNKQAEFKNADLDQQWNMFSAQLKENARQFDITTTEGQKQFRDTMQWAKEKFDLTKQQEYDFMNAQLKEQFRQFNTSTLVQREQFFNRMEWAKEEFNLSQDQQWDIMQANFEQQLNMFDLTSSHDLDMLNTQIEAARDNLKLTQEHEKRMLGMQLTEQARQFDLTREDNLMKYFTNLEESMRQFDMSFEMESWYKTQSLNLAKEQLTLDADVQRINALIAFGQSPIFNQYSDSEEFQDVGMVLGDSIIQDLMTDDDSFNAETVFENMEEYVPSDALNEIRQRYYEIQEAEGKDVQVPVKHEIPSDPNHYIGTDGNIHSY